VIALGVISLLSVVALVKFGRDFMRGPNA
jgi:hypothetical protein